jgi:chemotaxis protein MotB
MTSGRRSFRERGSGNDGHGHGGPSSERWLLTYADMITLLLVLFIVLFALSKINQAKYRQFVQSVNSGKIVGDSVVNGNSTTPSFGSAPLSPLPAQLKQIEKALTKALNQHGLLHSVSLKQTSQGLVIGLVSDSTFFLTDSAQLSVQGLSIIDTSGSVIAKYGNSVDVAGYTDNQPITGGPYQNNWALSAARSVAVVERLTTVDGVDPTKVVSLGYGQYHPVVPDSSPANQAQNRRVNIIIKPSGQSPTTGGTTQGSAA